MQKECFQIITPEFNLCHISQIFISYYVKLISICICSSFKNMKRIHISKELHQVSNACPLSGMFCFPGYLFMSFYTLIDFDNVIAPKSALWICDLGILYEEVPGYNIINTLISRTLFWLPCIHSTWLADGAHQTST